MYTYRIKNWDRFQHYKKRNPPWIKLHFEILSSPDWVTLSDASRVLAIACMLLASRHDGQIPDDLEYLKRAAYLNRTPDLTPLIDCGFLELQADASTMQADARPETETETETEKKEVGNGADAPPLSDVEKAFYNWNVTAEDINLPVAKNLSPDRRKKLLARLSEVGLSGWNQALENLERSDFCKGQNDRGWKATFDFMLQPKSLNTLREGGYANAEHATD